MLDSNQSVTFKNTVSGGAGPYTYFYSVTPKIGFIKSGNTFIFGFPGKYNVTVTATDKNGAYAINFSTVIVNTAFAASPTPIASNSVISNGQYSTFTIPAPTTGTPPYTYQWYWGGSATCSEDMAIGQTGLNYTASPTGTGSSYFCVQETDSAATNSIVYTGTTQLVIANNGTTQVAVNTGTTQLVINNGTTQVAVNNALQVSLSPSSALLDVNQSIALHSTVSGGTAPYTSTYSVTPNSGFTYNGSTFTFTAPNRYTVMLIVTDEVGVSSEYASTVTVESPLSVSIVATNSTIKAGGVSTLIANASGGTGSYKYQWYNASKQSKVVAVPDGNSDTLTIMTNSTDRSASLVYYVNVTDIGTSNGATPIPTVQSNSLVVSVKANLDPQLFILSAVVIVAGIAALLMKFKKLHISKRHGLALQEYGVPYLLVAAAILLSYFLFYNSDPLTLLSFAVLAVPFVHFRFSARIFAGFAALMLALSVVLFAVFSNPTYANQLAIYAYWLLVVGVICLIIEYKRNRG
jgi:hypothetical protein